MKYYFSNIDFEYSHEKAPRGKGYWAFTVKGVEAPHITEHCMLDRYGRRTDTTFFIDEYLTLTEAKKLACKLLEKNGISYNKTIYVAP
jgi:hypothetical protein